MKRLIFILTGIVLVYVLLLMGALDRHEDHPRFQMVKPLPDNPDTAQCEPGKYGDRIIVGTIGDPKTFNPVVASETSSTDIIRKMFSSLVRFNQYTHEFLPGLTYTWELSEDNLELTFHLRR